MHPQQKTDESPSSSMLVGEDTFKFKDMEFRLGPINLIIEGRFEQRCEDNEGQGIERRFGKVSNGFYYDLKDQYLDRLGSKHWKWKNMSCIMARSNDEGLKDLYSILIHWYNNDDPQKPIRPPDSPYPQCCSSVARVREVMEDIWSADDKWKELQVKVKRLTDPNLSDPTLAGER